MANCRIRVVLLRLLAVLSIIGVSPPSARAQNRPIWTVPEIGALPRNNYGLQVRAGRDLITATYAYIGPHVPEAAKRYAGNDLACTNCHLEAGTKKFAIPLFGLLRRISRNTAPAPAPTSASRIASTRACLGA